MLRRAVRSTLANKIATFFSVFVFLLLGVIQTMDRNNDTDIIIHSASVFVVSNLASATVSDSQPCVQ